jgi:hypothetical protein
MAMREECKFYESRTYPNGDAVRKCDLDLAPEAPWRCPDACPAYQPRLADVNWSYGTLITPPTPAEPQSLGDDPSIAALLDEAEDIINSVVDTTRAEVDAEGWVEGRRPTKAGPLDAVKKLFRRRK